MCKVKSSIYDCTKSLSIIQRMKVNLFYTYLSAFEPSKSIYRVLRLSYRVKFIHPKQQSNALTYIQREVNSFLALIYKNDSYCCSIWHVKSTLRAWKMPSTLIRRNFLSYTIWTKCWLSVGC